MGKSRMMGAGNASATLYKCDPNIPTGGGNKKQGITSRVGLDNWQNREIQTQSNGIGRFKLFFMSQLGGVEPGHSMFGGRWNRADGLTMNMYTRQLNHVIKQDESNGIFHPIEKRETIVKSTGNKCNLHFKSATDTSISFETKGCGIYGFSPSVLKINGEMVALSNNTVTAMALSSLDDIILSITLQNLNGNDVNSVSIDGMGIYYPSGKSTLTLKWNKQ